MCWKTPLQDLFVPKLEKKLLLLQNYICRNTDEIETNSGVVLDRSILVRYNLTALLICLVSLMIKLHQLPLCFSWEDIMKRWHLHSLSWFVHSNIPNHWPWLADWLNTEEESESNKRTCNVFVGHVPSPSTSQNKEEFIMSRTDARRPHWGVWA